MVFARKNCIIPKEFPGGTFLKMKSGKIRHFLKNSERIIAFARQICYYIKWNIRLFLSFQIDSKGIAMSFVYRGLKGQLSRHTVTDEEVDRQLQRLLQQNLLTVIL